MVQKIVSADDVFQEAVLALARNMSTYDGPVTTQMIAWAVGRGWRNAGLAALPICVTPTKKSDCARTRMFKLAIWLATWEDCDDEDIEETIPGRERDPAEGVELRDTIRVLARSAEPRDFLRSVRSAVRDVPLAEDARARGVTTQAESWSNAAAKHRVAASLRRAA